MLHEIKDRVRWSAASPNGRHRGPPRAGASALVRQVVQQLRSGRPQPVASRLRTTCQRQRRHPTDRAAARLRGLPADPAQVDRPRRCCRRRASVIHCWRRRVGCRRRELARLAELPRRSSRLARPAAAPSLRPSCAGADAVAGWAVIRRADAAGGRQPLHESHGAAAASDVAVDAVHLPGTSRPRPLRHCVSRPRPQARRYWV